MKRRITVALALTATFLLAGYSLTGDQPEPAEQGWMSAHPVLGALPEGHPPIPGRGYAGALPEGHPPISGKSHPRGLPEGHPPVTGHGLPDGHPVCPYAGEGVAPGVDRKPGRSASGREPLSI